MHHFVGSPGVQVKNVTCFWLPETALNPHTIIKPLYTVTCLGPLFPLVPYTQCCNSVTHDAHLVLIYENEDRMLCVYLKTLLGCFLCGLCSSMFSCVI